MSTPEEKAFVNAYLAMAQNNQGSPTQKQVGQLMRTLNLLSYTDTRDGDGNIDLATAVIFSRVFIDKEMPTPITTAEKIKKISTSPLRIAIITSFFSFVLAGVVGSYLQTASLKETKAYEFKIHKFESALTKVAELETELANISFDIKNNKYDDNIGKDSFQAKEKLLRIKNDIDNLQDNFLDISPESEREIDNAVISTIENINNVVRSNGDIKLDMKNIKKFRDSLFKAFSEFLKRT